jgi:hypothetical protein
MIAVFYIVFNILTNVRCVCVTSHLGDTHTRKFAVPGRAGHCQVSLLSFGSIPFRV